MDFMSHKNSIQKRSVIQAAFKTGMLGVCTVVLMYYYSDLRTFYGLYKF